VVIARDGANNRGNDSAADKALPFTSSLPRQLRHRGFKGSSSEGPGEAGQGQTANVYGRQTPVQQLERSRSVTPQHWKMRQFTGRLKISVTVRTVKYARQTMAKRKQALINLGVSSKKENQSHAQ